MAAFSEGALVKKLADLNPSQQSIQTLSLWLIHHRKHHAAIVKVWYKELIKGNHKLRSRCFYYYLRHTFFMFLEFSNCRFKTCNL